jgi:hypothetical protein
MSIERVRLALAVIAAMTAAGGASEMVDAGKAHCVENTINANNQVINFTVRHNAFKMRPSGGSTWMVFEPKVKTATRIEGRIRTTEPQKSFEDIPYSYDITFSLPVAPRQK